VAIFGAGDEMKKEELIKALSFLSDILSQMTDEEFRALVQGKLRWVLEEKEKPKEKAEKPAAAEGKPGFADIEAFLATVRDEAEARAFLAAHPSTKTNANLLALGRALKAPVKSRQRKEELIQAIVRHTVGRRLQSEAISRVTAHEGHNS